MIGRASRAPGRFAGADFPPWWRRHGGSLATLNVKNLPDPLDRKLRAGALRQRRSIAQDVTLILTEAVERERPLSLRRSWD